MDNVKKALTNLGIFSILFAIFLFVMAILYLLFVVDLGSDDYVKLQKLCESVKRKGDARDPNYEECTNLDYLLAAGFIPIFIACVQLGGAIAFGLVVASKLWPNWIAFHIFAGISCIIEVGLIGLNHLGNESYLHVNNFNEKYDDRGLYIKMLIGACGADSGFCALGCIILGIIALRQKIKERERQELEEEDRLNAEKEQHRILEMQRKEQEEDFTIYPQPITSPTNFNIPSEQNDVQSDGAQRQRDFYSPNTVSPGNQDSERNKYEIPASLRSAPFQTFPTTQTPSMGTRRIPPQKPIVSNPNRSKRQDNYLPIPAAPYSDPGTSRNSSNISSKFQPASAQPSKNYTYEPAQGRIMAPPIPPPRPPSPHDGSQKFSVPHDPGPSVSRKQRRVSVARANIVESNNNNNNNNNNNSNNEGQFYRPRGSVSAAPVAVRRNRHHFSHHRRATSNVVLNVPSHIYGNNPTSSAVSDRRPTVNFSNAPTATTVQSEAGPSSNNTSTHTHRYSSQ